MQPEKNRRDFLKLTAAATAGAATGSLAISQSAHAAGSDILRIGLIGCGGRGGGAAANALGADANTRLVAMADVFSDRLHGTLNSLSREFKERVAVDAERRFVGFDAYQKLIESGVDVVLLATPPHFRPIHLKACIVAGKHVFCEKPVAVDAPGCGACWRRAKRRPPRISMWFPASAGDMTMESAKR